MSELINTISTNSFRRQLLVTVSALALLGSMIEPNDAFAASGDQAPAIWIELGGQLEQLNNVTTPFTPSFLPASKPDYATVSSIDVQRPPKYSVGEEATISFMPGQSEWVLSASVRYGRSNGNKRVHESAGGIIHAKAHFFGPISTQIIYSALFTDTRARHNESHLVVDFQAGKDVGLGMFGGKSSSILNFGVRFAQFNTRSNIAIASDPDQKITYSHFLPSRPSKYRPVNHYHTYKGALQGARSFHGIGPSLSWASAVPLAGSSDSAEIKLDWGINAAILFGRQKTRVKHQTSARYYNGKYPGTVYEGFSTPYHHATTHTRSKTVVVPNVGGFAGLSFNYSNAKLKLGYRADFFFGAMDGGIDVARKENVGFYGPFASVSVGIGG